jgi:hypothetical protein
MSPKTKTTISSPLVSALNNIVSINRSGSTMKSTQQSYQGFLKFMDVEIRNIESIKLPKKKDLQKLSNLNVAATFGSAGSLLSSLVSGALDAAGFIGDFFGGKKRGGGKPNPKAGGAIPKGKGIRLGGMKAIGIANAAFAGLDFATGLAEGESVGKAAAGAGGALAGSLIGGAIGQTLIPIPGLGFVVGSMAGNFLGGYLGDRAHEAATGTGKQDLKSKQKEKLKAQEQKQKLAAMSSGLTMGSVLDKFDSVVTKFERMQPGTSAAETSPMNTASGEKYGENIDPNAAKTQGDLPSGEDVALDGEGTFIQGSTGRSTGPHFHIGPTELYDPVGDKWVGRRTEQGKKDAREAGFKVAKTLMQRKKYFRFTNAGIDVNPGSKLDDATLMKYVEREQAAHAGRSMGGSHGGLDIAGSPGLRMPLPVGDVTPSVHGFGNSARILGTNAFVGHGMTGSKKTADANIKRSGTPPTANQENITPGTQQSLGSNTTPPTAPKPTPTPTKQELSGMSTTQLKGMLDPTKTGASNPSVFAASQEARTKGQESGLTGEDLERAVMIASIQAKNAAAQVQAVSQQPVAPEQLQQYPTYNQQQSTTTIVPMMMGSGGGQRRPQVISVPGTPGETIVLPGPTDGQLVNSLFKTMLLTSLSGS